MTDPRERERERDRDRLASSKERGQAAKRDTREA